MDKRRIKLEKILDNSFIPFGGGRPERERAIDKEDLMNLQISLETCGTVDDFLKEVK